MTTYTDVFGNETIPPSAFRYRSVALSANTTLFWPDNNDGPDLASTIMDVAAGSAGLSLTLPAASEVSLGRDLLVRNTGAESLDLKDNGGSVIATIAAGVVKYLYVTDNSTAAGVWAVFTYGTGTSGADASALASNGLAVDTSKLIVNLPYNSTSTTYAVSTGDRAKTIVFSSSGAVNCNLPAASDAGDGFFFLLSNQGSGAVTVDPSGSELVDGSSTKAVAPTESSVFVCSGTEWFSVGYGRGATFAFTQLVKDISAGGSFTLSASEYANKLLRFIGTAPNNITIIVPAVAAVYYTQNAYSGAFTLTVKTSGGTGVTMNNSDRSILLCDGTNVVVAQSADVSAPTSIVDGTAGAPSLFFASDTDTGIFLAGANTFGISGAGTEMVRFAPAGMTLAVDLAVTEGGTGSSSASGARANLGAAATGLATASGITMATARLIGRTTASTGALEEISAGTGLSLAAGSLSVTGVLLADGSVSMTGVLKEKKGSDIASAATTDLGTATGNSVDVTHSTGTTAITSLGGASLQAGTEIETRFVITGGTLTLTHHATNLYLAGGANITLANGDVIRWRKMHSSNAEWKMVGGVKADGTAWVGSNPFSVIDAAGDLIVGTADNTAGRLAIGTALQQLRVNAGATALEWATIASSGGLLAVTTFTGNGTWNKSTNNPSKIMVMAVGGGGAGGGAGQLSSVESYGLGGQAGAVNWAYTASPASSYSITIGAGGTGVGATDGNAGSSTTVGALLTAGGGQGGVKVIPTAATFTAVAGEAGASCLGTGGAKKTTAGAGNAASANTGAGGGGAYDSTNGNRAGGAGGSGLVIIWEFA